MLNAAFSLHSGARRARIYLLTSVLSGRFNRPERSEEKSPRSSEPKDGRGAGEGDSDGESEGDGASDGACGRKSPA